MLCCVMLCILTCGKVNKFKQSRQGCLARKIVIAKIYVHDMQITACLHWQRVTHAGTFKLLDSYRITREKLLCRLLISSCIRICLYDAGQNRYGYPSNSATKKTGFMREGDYSSSVTFLPWYAFSSSHVNTKSQGLKGTCQAIYNFSNVFSEPYLLSI